MDWDKSRRRRRPVAACDVLRARTTSGLANALTGVQRKLDQYAQQCSDATFYRIERVRGVGIRLVAREQSPRYSVGGLPADCEPTALFNVYAVMTGQDLARGPPSELEAQIAQDHRFVAVMQRIRTAANDYYVRLGGSYLDKILSKY